MVLFYWFQPLFYSSSVIKKEKNPDETDEEKNKTIDLIRFSILFLAFLKTNHYCVMVFYFVFFIHMNKITVSLIFIILITLTGCSQKTADSYLSDDTTSTSGNVTTGTVVVEKTPSTIGIYSGTINGKPFSVSYPTGWAVSEENENVTVTFLAPKNPEIPEFQVNMNIIAEDLSGENLSLESYLDISLTNLESAIEDMKIIQKSPVTLNNKEFYMLSFDGKYANIGMRRHQYFTIENNVAYIFTLTTPSIKDYPEYEAAVRLIAETFTH